MTDQEALRRLREKAAQLRAERPDYPDSPEQLEEQRQLAEALYEPQMRAMADLFYEDDEPVEKIEAAFERGAKGVTRRPERD